MKIELSMKLDGVELIGPKVIELGGAIHPYVQLIMMKGILVDAAESLRFDTDAIEAQTENLKSMIQSRMVTDAAAKAMGARPKGDGNSATAPQAPLGAGVPRRPPGPPAPQPVPPPAAAAEPPQDAQVAVSGLKPRARDA